MDWKMTPEEMKRAIGLKESDAMADYAHGLSDFMVIADAAGRKALRAVCEELGRNSVVRGNPRTVHIRMLVSDWEALKSGKEPEGR